MNDLQEQILDYVKRHPGAKSAEIAQALGLYVIQVNKILFYLEGDGHVTSEMSNAARVKDRVKLYRATRTAGTLSDVLASARQIGGPFGILAAQVMV